jgi:hypothetical protein
MNSAYSESIMWSWVRKWQWRGEAEGSFAAESGLGLIELQIVSKKGITELVQCSRDKGAVLGCRNKANIVNDSGTNKGREHVAVVSENVGEGANEKEGAQRIALCNAFEQCIWDDAVHVEGREGVSGEMHAWVSVVKEAEPGREQGRLEKLDSAP